ncbi:MAG: hypothetical protein OXC98_01610 [bacterium]|nr:hypothetical protein [bacterium]
MTSMRETELFGKRVALVIWAKLALRGEATTTCNTAKARSTALTGAVTMRGRVGGTP